MTRVQIQCRRCGFPFRFADEAIEYGPSCPRCHAYYDRVEVEVEVRDPATIMAREPVVGFVDQLDVVLALWIAESMTETARPSPLPRDVVA